MAKYFRPRRGARSYASAQNIVLKSGEMFMEVPTGYTIGRSPGRIILGSGSSSYSSLNYATTSSTAYQPFITDPRLYTPIFKNSTYATSNWTVNAATAAISGMGSGTGSYSLPTIIGKIKEALCKHEDSITALNNELAAVKSYVGLIIHSTTLDTEAKVKEIYGGTTWIQHSGYVLRGATSGVTSNDNTNTGGDDSVSYTPAGSNTGMSVTFKSITLSHSGGAVQNHTLTTAQIPSHSHLLKLRDCSAEAAGWGLTTSYPGFAGRVKVNIATGSDSTLTAGSGGAHNHGFTQPNSHTFTPTATCTNPTFKGSPVTINTLPSYKSVYIWERVA